MKTQSTRPYRTRFHRDGTVTLWSVYHQQWERWDAAAVSEGTLATLPKRERDRIGRMAAQHPQGG